MAVRLLFGKLMLLKCLLLGFRRTPVTAAEMASRPRPCWLAYPASERVVPLPDRTPWHPRQKAGRDGTESLDSRQSALSGPGQGDPGDPVRAGARAEI